MFVSTKRTSLLMPKYELDPRSFRELVTGQHGLIYFPGTTTFSITTFSRTTLNIKGLFVTLSINDIQHKRHSALQKCHYAEFCYFLTVMLNVNMLSVVMLSVVILNVVAPFSLNQKFNLIYNFQFMFKHFFYKYFDYHV
jgi:hypothetical protein